MCTPATLCDEAKKWRKLYLAARSAVLCLESSRPHMAVEWIAEARIHDPEPDVMRYAEGFTGGERSDG